MRKIKEALLTLFEALAVGGGLLLVPCILADLAFGFALTLPLAQGVLAAAMSAAILTAIAIYEGWYTHHLTRPPVPDEQPSRLKETLGTDGSSDER